jgi:Cft2 family RNA processing exonuclease
VPVFAVGRAQELLLLLEGVLGAHEVQVISAWTHGYEVVDKNMWV